MVMGSTAGQHLSPHKRFLFLLLLLMLSWHFVPENQASASIVVPMSLKDLTEHADLIVVGISSEITSDWDSKRRNIFTYITLVPERCFKVTECPNQIWIRQLGGTVDGITQIVHGGPRFHKNEKVVLFLEKTAGNYYRVIGLSQGKFSVVHHQNENKDYVTRDLSRLTFADRQGSEVNIQDFRQPETEIDLESFLENIESHLELP